MNSAPGTLLKWVEIDRRALSANLKWVRGRLGPTTQLMAVVKADAYGHGSAQAARLFLSGGADCLGVFTLEEALALRSAGLRGRIVLLAPPLPSQAKAVAKARLEATVASMDLARALNKAGGRTPVHVDLDYGLGRWGIPPRTLPDFLNALSRMKGLRLAGVCAHLSYVPGQNAVEAEEKLRDFSRAAASAKSRYPKLVFHAANSSILLDFPRWQMDMVRIGNLLYGIKPAKYHIPLAVPWRLKARIIALRDVPKGTQIGYAAEYIAPRRMRVATLPVGYSDGLTMEPANRLIRLGHGLHFWGMLRGHKAPFIGRCGICHVLVDVSHVPGARLGEAVALPSRRTAANGRLARIYV